MSDRNDGPKINLQRGITTALPSMNWLVQDEWMQCREGLQQYSAPVKRHGVMLAARKRINENNATSIENSSKNERPPFSASFNLDRFLL